MSLRQLTLLIPAGDKKTLKSLEADTDIIEVWFTEKNNSRLEINLILASEKVQAIIDKIQSELGKKDQWRIIISPVEATIPRPKEVKEDTKNSHHKLSYGSMSREALYDQIFRGSKANLDFIILVVLSTIVTLIGLVTNNLAVIIGAMVIAPLLGPNLALSFGVTLGDKQMINQALKTNAVGFSITMAMGVVGGFFIPYEVFMNSNEYLSRTLVGYDGIILALASGSAAVLSLTTGVSSTMVGVMVAVALMPPAVAFGLSIGAGEFGQAYGAALLLAINVICVNIAAKVVFTLKGIRPRTWYLRQKSEQSLKLVLIFWGLMLVILIGLIYLWH